MRHGLFSGRLSGAIFPWLVGLGALVGFGAASGHVFHEARCAVILPEVDPAPRRARLLGCSNIEQRFDAPQAVDLPAETSGWRMFTPGEKDTVTVSVRLRKYTDRVIFYPRLLGSDASVTVNEPVGQFRKKLFSLTGRDGTWTPVGDQYGLCLGCVENGWSDEEFPVTLDIVLTGRGAQLWHKGDTVFFEAP